MADNEEFRLRQIVGAFRSDGALSTDGWIAERENGWSPCRADGHSHKTAEQAAKCWRER